MIESGILIICDEPTTSGIGALCVNELHCRPLAANSIAPVLLLTPINNETHTLEACQAVSREEHSVE